MKKSNLALIFTILCLFFPAIFIITLNVFGGPETIDSDGYNYLVGFSILLMLLGSFFIAIFGSILAFLGYRKNKPDLILYAMILIIVTFISFLTYPSYLLLPVLLGVLAFFSWRDVKKLANNAKHEAAQNAE